MQFVHCVHIGKKISCRGVEILIAVGRNTAKKSSLLLLFLTVVEDVSVVGKSKKNKYRLHSYVTCGNPPPAMFGFTDKRITTFPPTHQLHIVAVKNELWSQWTQSADKKLVHLELPLRLRQPASLHPFLSRLKCLVQGFKCIFWLCIFFTCFTEE